MGGIFQFFTALLGKFAQLAEWLILCFKQVFVAAWHVLTDLIAWTFESLINVAIGALNAIAIPFNPQTYYSMIPPEAAQMLGYIGIPQALSIIVSGLLIRFVLQTIPFVRWGS
jgi:hypothetical protein